MMMNPDVDSYTKALNPQKILLKIQKDDCLLLLNTN